MKKVLIALDNNSNYNVVSSNGYELAKALGASIALLHVFPDTITTNPNAFSGLYPMMETMEMEDSFKLAERLDEESKIFLNQVKAEMNDELSDIYTAEGDVADAVIATAKSYKANIIIIGSHSRSGIDRLLMGNVAQKIVKHSHIPMFIIPVN